MIRAHVAHEFAIRLAGTNHSRRLYGMNGPAWERTLTGLHEAIEKLFLQIAQDEITVALLGDGLAVMGVPIGEPPTSVLRLVSQLQQRDVEIVSIKRGCSESELDALFAYLGADAADVAAMKADTWLRERGVENVRIKHLALMRGSGVESFRDVYWRGKRVLDREFRRANERGEVNMGAVGELARALKEVILDADAPIATLLALRDRDDFALVHSVNVATLVGAQAGALGLPEAQVERLLTAALMHDIGKTRVAEGILARDHELSDKERALLDRHTVEGARLLFDTSGDDPLAAIVAEGHHRVPSKNEPGLLAIELTRIADAFDGIRTLWPFDDADGMKSVIGYLVGRIGSRFNPYLLERFARFAGACQAGDGVWLSTGEFGAVLEPHPELALHPVVRIVAKKTGHLEAGKRIDLGEYAHDPKCPYAVPPVPEELAAVTARMLDDLG
ncbi:MAG: HD domain-containing protein [Deltaproteobacteria bacterium]